MAKANLKTNSSVRKQRARKAGKCQLCGEKTPGYSVVRSKDGSYKRVKPAREGYAFYCKDHADRKVVVRTQKAARLNGKGKAKTAKRAAKKVSKAKPKPKRVVKRKSAPKSAKRPAPKRKVAPKSKARKRSKSAAEPF